MGAKVVIGLGNPLMGDDGIGWHVAREVAKYPDLPADTDVAYGGSDLLRHDGVLADRDRVIIVDAVFDGFEPGTVRVLDEDFDDWEERQGHAHQLSAVAAIQLLRASAPRLANTRFTIISVSVASVRAEERLSAPMSAKLPQIVRRVVTELSTT